MDFIANAINIFTLYKGRVITTLIALSSMSLAHYAGFLIDIPLQIVAAAGPTMATGVTATFVFYIALTAVFSRVFIGIFQAILLPFLLLANRVEHGRKLCLKKKRKLVTSYNELIAYESYAWLLLQAIFFLILILVTYIKFTLSWKSGVAVLVAVILVAISGLFRARLLLVLNWPRFKYRIKHRPATKAAAISATFVTLASALIVISFFIGHMRMSLLRNDSPQQITNRYFSGYANLLATSGSASLIIEHSGNELRYIYTTESYGLSIESKPKFFQVLSR